MILALAAVILAACSTPANQAGIEPRQAAAVGQQPLEAAEVEQPAQIQAPAEIAQQATLPSAIAPQPSPTAPEPVRPEPTATAADAAPAAEPLAAEEPAPAASAANPLTGLPVADQTNLALSPALVSITNFPTTARPQAGLSYSPFVFEMYIGEGMTRFLAVFYGDYPQAGGDSAVTLADDRIGPVRSGRLPYESLRKLYNGFLVMASASPNVKASLSAFSNVWGDDTSDINSAMIPVTKLKEIAGHNPARLEAGRLAGLAFDQAAPAGGKTGTGLWIPYNYLNQVIWRYDQASGAYHRYQDNADGQTFIKATDRLTEQPLTYENVIILFANHQAERETLIDINLMYVDKMPALLFRDGQMYEIFWTTANGDFEKTTGLVRPIRFVDAEGNPFPLKPGQTWVEIVQTYTRYNETVDSEVYFDLKKKTEPGSGFWAVHFFPTVPER
jgi:hypothetical protein